MASGKAVTWEAGTTAGNGRGIPGIHAWGGCQLRIIVGKRSATPRVNLSKVRGTNEHDTR
jgi:hypothetical protein